jgi:hypothetical protein
MLAEGLDPACATGKHPLVWLHTSSRTSWAILHLLKRHRVDVADMVLLDVQVPRRWLRRAWRGLWTCTPVIPPARLQVLDSQTVAAHHLETA